MSYGIEPKPWVGRKLAAVLLDEDKEHLALYFQDGGVWKFRTDGDCCSHTWIEHVTVPDDIDGATFLGAEDSDTVTEDNHPEHDCLQIYKTTFQTDRGGVVVEYRNESNGYYGGSLEEVGE
jgi:hypothetical protein